MRFLEMITASYIHTYTHIHTYFLNNISYIDACAKVYQSKMVCVLSRKYLHFVNYSRRICYRKTSMFTFSKLYVFVYITSSTRIDVCLYL